jgi:sulfur-carrier protein adenylyltransferase/sulfurtransferase
LEISPALTRAARSTIVSAGHTANVYYLDCGNDTDRGQVILGQMMPKHAAKTRPDRLPHAGDLLPELVDASLDAKDETPSCSMADALRKQSLVINQAIAVQAFNMLWTMFRTGGVPYSGVFVNLATGRTNPIPIDPVAWARFGYDAPVPPVKNAAKRRKAKSAS